MALTMLIGNSNQISLSLFAPAQTLASAKTPTGLNQSIVDPSAADAYPIVTFSWLLLYREYPEADKVAALRNFVGWWLSKEQTFAEKLGYLPLPSEVTATGEQALGSVGK